MSHEQARAHTRIAIVTPTLALRAGLRALLAASHDLTNIEQAFEVVYEAAQLEDFIADFPGVDLLLLDGELASELEQLAVFPAGQLGVLLLTGDPSAARRLLSLPLRGWGIIPMDAATEELSAAVQAVHQGLVVGASSLLEPVLSRMLFLGASDQEALAEALTEREEQVLQLLALGLPNKQIAQKLNISEHTVKFHVSSIYSKFGATNRTEAVRAGLQRGLISL